MTESIFDKAKAAAANVSETITNIKGFLWDDEKTEIISQFKEKAEEKLNEVIDTIAGYKSLFADAGYEVTGLNASLTIPPDIAISFTLLNKIDKANREKYLAQTGDSRLAAIILKSLFKASDFADTIKLGEMKLKSINITLGLIPGISISMS